MTTDIKVRISKLIEELVELYNQEADLSSQEEMMLINLEIEKDKYNGY